MDRGIAIERADQREKLVLRGSGGPVKLDRMEAELARPPALAGNIDPARRVLTDKDHREPRHDARLRRQAAGLFRNRGCDLGRDRAAVDQPGALSGRQRCARH